MSQENQNKPNQIMRIVALLCLVGALCFACGDESDNKSAPPAGDAGGDVVDEDDANDAGQEDVDEEESDTSEGEDLSPEEDLADAEEDVVDAEEDLADVEEDLPAEPPELEGLGVFVSSYLLSGDSVPRSDRLCGELAEAAGYDGQWVSWISTGEQHALEKISGEGPWVLVDNTVVFPDLEAFAAGPLVPIHKDEHGETVEDEQVYTGTSSAGEHTGVDCRRWRSYYNDDMGTVGNTSSAEIGWTQAEDALCGQTRRVYCFQVESREE